MMRSKHRHSRNSWATGSGQQPHLLQHESVVPVQQKPYRARSGVVSNSSTIKAACGYGFTLVEMLVAVTLVLLMLVMFGEVFQLASGSVTKQRIMADNDQNVRSFVTVLRADLDKRTMRSAVPFFSGELASNPGTPFGGRPGYFYISNNVLTDHSDDVLQWTVKTDDEFPYDAHAVPIYNAPVPTTVQRNLNFLNFPNQPDRDNGQAISDLAASSRAAEVSYWMRGGKLYRRVMLLRDPVPAAGVDPSNPAQPSFLNPNIPPVPEYIEYFQPTAPFPLYYVPSPTANFWNDFDFSAYPRPAAPIAGLAPYAPIFAQFLGLDSLSNDVGLGGSRPNVVAMPWNRWGHNSDVTSVGAGLPREFGNGTPNIFLGRFTQAETSDPTFQYPHGRSPFGNGNPLDAANAVNDANNDSVVDEFNDGLRVGVDMLLAHVHEFRVEVWDERVGDFVTVGHGIGGGDFSAARNLNTAYAPVGGLANIFDTWHPFADLPATPTPDSAPFRPMNYYPPPLPGPNATYWTPGTSYTTEDANGNGVLDAGEDGTVPFGPANGVLDAHRVFPSRRDIDLNGNGIVDPGDTDYNGNLLIDAGGEPFRPFGHMLVYRCVKAGTSSSVIANEQPWRTTPGPPQITGNLADDTNMNGVLDPGETDWNLNGVLDPAEPNWICEYNLRPLRAIRVTVRFEHPSSKQMRQVTIVHSLRDTTTVP